jgi:phosphoglucomutase
MKIQSTIKIGEPVQLIFTVYNNTESPKQFCKWHTPFEPLMSKYLEIKDANGVEMNYQGPMAKRIMPPPAISYIVVKSKESISATVNLGSAYNLTGPSKYTIKYTGNEMSGLPGVKAASFVYRE